MINFLDTLYYKTNSISPLLSKFRLDSLIRLLIRTFANIFIPLYFHLTCKNKKYKIENDCNENNNKIENINIVSLTSFPARINRVWLVIETILRQTKKPDLIILWLSKEQFPNIQSIPKNLQKLKKRGLRIELKDNDLRSHKKYYYSLIEYPNANLITIDDDILYKSTMIENLLYYSTKYPGTVISQYSKKIIKKNNKLLSYNFWPIVKHISEPSSNLFFGTGGGTLFPPNSFYKDVTNIKLSLELTPTADDIWLNVMCKLNNVKVMTTQSNTSLLPIMNYSNFTLSKINNGLEQNDFQINKIKEYYMLNLDIDPFSYIGSV